MSATANRRDPRDHGPCSPCIAGARRVELIGAAMGLGGPDRGAAAAPARLRTAGLADALSSGTRTAEWSPTLLPRVDAGASRRAVVDAFNARLARRVQGALERARFPLVVGGDHSIAAGTWTGVARHLARSSGALGLVWIDAHMDAHTAATTPSGNPHGMPLATLLGANGGAPMLAGEHVAVVGVRSYEAAEAALLRRLGVRVYYQAEIGERGLDVVLAEAFDRAAGARGGIGVTLDIDALDPYQAPGTGTPVAGGLRADELAAALAGNIAERPLAAAEIVEFSPRADRGGRTERLVRRLAATVCG